MTRDIFQLSGFVTLHFSVVENFQPSFCTLGGVLILVFAKFSSSSSGNVGNLSSGVISQKRSWEMGKFGKSAVLNSAIVNYKRKRWQQH